MLILHEGVKKVPKSRVELHIHLDGAVRLETAWDLLRRKQLPMPGDGSMAALKFAFIVTEPSDLAAFLKPFMVLIPAIQGDLDAIERISREFVEDRSRDHIAYCEARFSPHLLLAPPGPAGEASASAANGSTASGSTVTVDDIMEAVIRGIAEGEKNCPGTKVRLLLCCIRSMPQWSWEVLRMCEQYRDRGVLGIDIAGSCSTGPGGPDYSEGAAVFQAAAAKGIRRTVHAGEDAPAASVVAAIDDLRAERIGHGYRVLEDDAAYTKCKEANIHFEVCPHSSYLTGSIKELKLSSKRHPILRFIEDGVSHSISTDDPTLTGSSLTTEYDLLRSWGLTEAHFVRANFQAALHSFLPAPEKQALLQQLRDALGIVDVCPTSANGSPAPSKPNITLNTWRNRSQMISSDRK